MNRINQRAMIKNAMPIYAYLKYRSAGDIALSRGTNQLAFNQLANELGVALPLLTDDLIFELEGMAVSTARKIWQKNFGIRVFDKTPEERELIKLLQELFDPTFVRIHPKIHEKGNYGEREFILGPFIPDAIAIGLRPGTKKFVCTAFEVDGAVHDWKMANDALYERVLELLEIGVRRFDSNQIKSSWKFSTQVRARIVDLKMFNKCRSDEHSILKVKRQIALFNIATWLTFDEIESFLKSKSALDFHLQRAYQLLRSKRDCPRRIKYLSAKIRDELQD